MATPKRRMGPGNSETSLALMDAVEAVMRESGYAALSARSVANRAGLKYQIVFYYFETMDELLLATYRRRTEQVLARTQAALQGDRPLHALWAISSDPEDAALSLEYIAMSNHNDVVRRETIAFGEHLRRVVADAVMAKGAGTGPLPTDMLGLTLAISSLGSMLGFEAAMGLSGGHDGARAVALWCLEQVEP